MIIITGREIHWGPLSTSTGERQLECKGWSAGPGTEVERAPN